MDTSNESAQDDLTVRPLEVAASPMRGLTTLHQSWIDGERDGVRVELSCGAGLGSPYLYLHVRKGDVSYYEQIDIRLLLQEWAEQVERDIDAGVITRETVESARQMHLAAKRPQ